MIVFAPFMQMIFLVSFIYYWSKGDTEKTVEMFFREIVYNFLILEEVPFPVEAVEDAEWSCRERPDGDPDVLDVPDWDPLPALVR